MQGMGWLTTEELVFDDEGRLRTHAPSTYKIPVASDVPADFRVALFPGANRAETIYRSKAVGEPPLMLANAVFCALADAVHALAPRPAGAARRAGDARSDPARLRGRSRAGAGLKAGGRLARSSPRSSPRTARRRSSRVHGAQGSAPREAGAAHGGAAGRSLPRHDRRRAARMGGLARGPRGAGGGAGSRHGSCEQRSGRISASAAAGRVTLRVETFDRRDAGELAPPSREGGSGCGGRPTRDGSGRVARRLFCARVRRPMEPLSRRERGWGEGDHLSASTLPASGGFMQAGEAAPHPIPLPPGEGRALGPASPRRARGRRRLAGPSASAIRSTPLLLFGAGHVGRALVLALAPLPFAVRWIDGRDDAFPAHIPANVTPDPGRRSGRRGRRRALRRLRPGDDP